MSLLDHFRPPLSARRHWHAFHNAWATYLASSLNERLPEGYFAEPNVQFGIEIDVATFEEPDPSLSSAPIESGGVTTWAPPAPSQTIAFTPAAEIVEVLVYENSAGPTLAGAIELVSPANQDRPAYQAAFVSKCETYLQAGVGLIILDIVTNRSVNFHNELLERISPGNDKLESALYAVSYRVVEREKRSVLDLWKQSLRVGESLPLMPLWLRGGICLPVDFAAAYERTCREQRIPA